MAVSNPTEQNKPPAWTEPLARIMRPHLWRAAFFAYVLASVLVNVWQVNLRDWLTDPDPVAKSRLWAAEDMDIAGYLLPGLRAHPTLASTLDWWHGTWAGIVPFWRPLTSLAFWLEYHTLTPDRFDRWMLVSDACHLAFLALLFLLVRRLNGRGGVAALTVLLFAGSPALPPSAWLDTLPLTARGLALGLTANVALDNWKNQPEMWAGLCALAATLLALRARWAGALVWAVLGVCFKESGWYTFPIVFLVLAQQRRLGTVPRWVYGTAGASALVLILLRAWAGPEVFRGYHFGTNVHWAARYSARVMGFYLGQLFSYRAACAVLAALLFPLLVWRHGRLVPRLLLGLGAFALCAGLYSLTNGGGWAVGLASLLDWDMGLADTLACLAWLFVAWRLLRRRDSHWLVLTLLLLGLLCAASLAAANQVQAHVLYLALAFQSCLVALALTAVADDLARACASFRLSPEGGSRPLAD